MAERGSSGSHLTGWAAQKRNAPLEAWGVRRASEPSRLDQARVTLLPHGRRRCGAWNFAYLKAGKSPDGDVFAEIGDGLVDFLADGHGFVLDVVLLIEARFFIELLHLALDDLLDDLLWLPSGARLGAVNLAFLLQHFRSHISSADVAGIDGGDVHGHVMAKILEGFGSRDEVALAIDLDDHADLPARMNVVSDQTLCGFARGPLGSGRLAFFAENFDRLLEEVLGARRIPQMGRCVNESCAAIAEPGVGSLPKFLYELGWNFHDWFACTHPFLSDFLNLSECTLEKWPGVRLGSCAGPGNG